MKKIYQTPSISIVQLKTTSIICNSTMSTMDIGGEATSTTVAQSRRRGIWNNDIWDNKE